MGRNLTSVTRVPVRALKPHLDSKRVKPMQKNTSHLSRRKVTAGLAWSVPAVAAVAAAPFAAA